MRMKVAWSLACLFLVVSPYFGEAASRPSSNGILWGITTRRRNNNRQQQQAPILSSILRIPQGGSAAADPAAAETTTTTEEGDKADEASLTLDQKVKNAMAKLGIGGSGSTTASQESANDAECKDGVCTIPQEQQSPPESENKQPAAVVDTDALAKQIAEEMNVHESIVFAALGATSTPSETNPMQRQYNEQAARDLIQQEVEMIQNVSEDSQEVKDLVSEGFDTFLCRRALAFTEMNIEDARAILLADQADAEEEERMELEAREAEEERQRQLLIQQQEREERERKQKEKEATEQSYKPISVDPTFDPTKPAAAPAAPAAPANNMPKPAKKADVVFEATSAQIQELVIESPVPVLLDIYADWCGPCKVLGPALEEMAVKAGGAFRLVKVNSDNERAVSGALEVTALPTVFGVKDGTIVHMFQGMPRSEEFMKNFMMGLLMPAGMAEFDPPLSSSDKNKYKELSSKLLKMAGSACFSFSDREALQDRLSMKIDALVKAHGGDLVDTEETVQILKSLISNIIKDPSNPKFRKINLTNKVIANKVAKFPPAISMLRSMGFVPENDGDSLELAKGKKMINVAPLTVARNYLEKWIDKSRYEVAAAARKRKDEADRAKLLEEEAARKANQPDEEEEEDEEEEIDPNMCQLKLRLDGKKKVHNLNIHADEPLSAVLDGLSIQGEEEIQITCVAKRLVVKNSDGAAMKKSLRDYGLLPSASLVVAVGSGKKDGAGGSSKLAERAAAQKKKKKGSHTMQSIGIYAKDDKNKAELIDGGGGVLYEHDVTDDEEEEEGKEEAETKEEVETEKNEEKEEGKGEEGEVEK